MTLDELNLPENETPEAPVVPEAEQAAPLLTLDALDEPVEQPATPPLTLDSLEEPASEEPASEEPVPEEPAPAEIPTPVYHTAPPEPFYGEVPAEPGAEKKSGRKHKGGIRKPHIALRILLQILSFILAVALFAAVLGTALLADLRELTSESGIRKIVNALLNPVASAPVTVHPAPVQADLLSGTALADSYYIPVDEDSASSSGDIVVDENGNVVIGGDVSVNLGEIPDDILTGGGGDSNVLNLVDWLYDQIDASTDKPLKYSREEMQEFVQESTVSDYLSEKLAGFTADFINGTEDTEISTRELIRLLKENEDLMQSKLNMELSDEQWDQIETTVNTIVVDNDLNGTIREKVYTVVDEVLESNSEILGNVDRQDIQDLLKTLTSNGLFLAFLGGAVLLLALLCLANYYNIPAGLTWAGVPTVLAGLLLSVPIMLLNTSADAVAEMVPSLSGLVGLLASFVDVFAPIHYIVLGVGAALVLASIIWRIVRMVLRKRKVAV